MSDLLSEATRALREQPGPEPRPEPTRARVMMSLHRERQSRGRRLTFTIPLAAILLGSTAWAGASGRLPSVVGAMKRMFWSVPAASSAPTVAASPPAAGRGVAAKQPLLEEPPKDELVAEAEAPPERSEMVEAVSREPSSPAPPVPARRVKQAPQKEARALPEPERDPSVELYRRAHELHFSGGDHAATLVAWDTYLREAPNGSFAPEARYNRALTLVRLGRRREAVAALTPFAEGRYGAYRQDEAKRLLDALDQSTP